MRVYCAFLLGIAAIFAIGQATPQTSDVKVSAPDDAERQWSIETWFELRTSAIDDSERSFGIDGWLEVELGSKGEGGAFSLWETKESMEFRRSDYGIGFDNLNVALFLKKHIGDDNILWQSIDGRLVRLTGKLKKANRASGFSYIITEVHSLIVVGIGGESGKILID